MTATPPAPLPHWLPQVPATDRAKARLRFLLRAAVLYATETGHTTMLNAVMGLPSKSLHNYFHPRTIRKLTDAMRADVERLTHGAVTAKSLLS